MKTSGPLTWVVLALLALAGCASSTSEDVESVTNSSENVEVSPRVPELGDVAEAVIELNLECRNDGSLEAFGISWRMSALAPLEWRDLESVVGELSFESLERSTFTAEGGSVTATNTMVVGDECSFWP